MRRIASLIGTVVLVGAAATVAFAHGGIAGAAHSKRVIRAQIDVPTFVRNDVDTAPTGPSEGDYYVFHDLLQNDRGVHVGRTDGHCTVVAIESGTTRYQCLVIETLQEGTIIHDGIFIPNDVSHFSIIGGTGDYLGAGGEAIFAAPNIEFSLTR